MWSLKVLVPLQAIAILGMCTFWLFSLGSASGRRPGAAKPHPKEKDSLPSCLSDSGVPFITGDDRNHTRWVDSIAPYNYRLAYAPKAVVVPKSIEHVQEAVRCAGRYGIRATPKSGGHSFVSSGLGGEDGHVVFDLSLMENVKLQKDNVTAVVQPGARLGHVATQLYGQGKRAISHGSCPGVGIGGHALHGGFGFSSRSRGLTLDYLTGATVVLSNGSVAHCSETQNPDLFWALRGAGSSFGIVTELEFKTFEPPHQIIAFTVEAPFRDSESIATCLTVLQEMAVTAPKELNMLFFLGPSGVYMTGTFDGTSNALEDVLSPLLNATGTEITTVETVGWIKSLEDFTFGTELDQTSLHYHSHASFYVSNAMTPALDRAQITKLSNALAQRLKVKEDQAHTWNIFLELHGGANSAVAKGVHFQHRRDQDNNDFQGSFPHRDKLLLWQFAYHLSSHFQDQPFPMKQATSLVKTLKDIVTANIPEGEWGMYANYPDSELKPELAQRMYYGKNLSRLQKIKAVLDPNEMFFSPGGVMLEKRKALKRRV